MAKFIELQCEKCGINFKIIHGPRKAEALAGISKEVLAVNEYARNEDLFNAITEHGKTCEGALIYKGLGFID